VGAYARQQQVSLIWNFDEVVIAADEERLLQVLINLLGNAIKFSAAGKAVRIDTHVSAGQLVCKVEDQGPGIPAQYLSTIFERYKQVSNSTTSGKGGTGLGLTICQAIVKAHSGDIGVDSAEGKGSTFWFKIPVTSFNKISDRQIPKQDSLG
jgi:signal transduction histidine kinase